MKRHDILELEQIPRDRKVLAAVIGQARYARRKARMMMLVSIGCIIIGVLLLWSTLGNRSRPAGPSPAVHTVTLPKVQQ